MLKKLLLKHYDLDAVLYSFGGNFPERDDLVKNQNYW